MADENYIDLYVDEKKDKEGITVTGKDVVQLNAPEVYLSPDTPLLTKAQDVAGAINELFSEGEGGGDDDDDDWQPPEWWIPVPEPEEYEMYFLVNVKSSVSVKIQAAHWYINGIGSGNWYLFSGVGPLSIDWGDGVTESWGGSSPEYWEETAGKTESVYQDQYGRYYPGYSGSGSSEAESDRWSDTHSHTYSSPGMYLIKLTGTEFCDSLYSLDFRQNAELLMLKLGPGIKVIPPYIKNVDFSTNVYGISLGTYAPALRYIKFNGAYGAPRQGFQNLYYLQKVDSHIVIDSENYYNDLSYPLYMTNLYSLKSFDFSGIKKFMMQISYTSLKKIDLSDSTECVSRGSQFQQNYNLESIKIPSLISVGNTAFYSCRYLKEIVLPECTSIDAWAFQDCYALKKVYAPKCRSIGDGAFYNCGDLQELIAADDCTAGNNTFYNCSCLDRSQFN